MIKIGDYVSYYVGDRWQIGQVLGMEQQSSDGCVWQIEIAPGLSQFYHENELLVSKKV